jgi:hypothetical protein
MASFNMRSIRFRVEPSADEMRLCGVSLIHWHV